MKRRLFVGLGLSLAFFAFNFAVAEEAKPQGSGTSAGEKSEGKPAAQKEKGEDEDDEDEIASADILSQQRVNDQFRSAQPSGQIESFRTGNQGPIRTDGYYEYQGDDYSNRPQSRR